MAENNFRKWVGFKSDAENVPSDSALERIRNLEAQLADMRSRRDITTLNKEEFEILASETAMSLIKTAQQREARATSAAERTISEAAQIAKEKIDSAEAKAKALLSGAESRGRKYIEAAEIEAQGIKAQGIAQAEALVAQAENETAGLTQAAHREAATIISSATREVSNFRTWLTSAISESGRLYQVQTQSLTAAERAITETRARLDSAFARLATLQGEIDANLDSQNRPVKKRFAAILEQPSETAKPETKPATKKVAPSRSKRVSNKKVK